MTQTPATDDTDDLLPADPTRGLTADALEDALGSFDGLSYRWGMHTAAGAARVSVLVEMTERVLGAGLGREAALACLHGQLVRLERDGLGEVSDTVVRETITSVLAAACEEAGVAEFTDDEVAEVSLLLSLRATSAAIAQMRRSLTG